MIFDTDILFWFLDGDAGAASLIQPEEDRAISIITLMELIQGAKSKAEAATIRSLLLNHDFNLLPIHEVIGYTAVRLLDEHAHRDGLRLPDALIAATALERGEVLATANLRHFRPVRGLRLKPFRPRAPRNGS
jgi:predicted nucleic acid-binding protein